MAEKATEVGPSETSDNNTNIAMEGLFWIEW